MGKLGQALLVIPAELFRFGMLNAETEQNKFKFAIEWKCAAAELKRNANAFA